jgi:hypothetical protein
MTMKIAKGMRLGCNPLLRRSETENTTKTRTKVPTNWSGGENKDSLKTEAGSHFIEKTIG